MIAITAIAIPNTNERIAYPGKAIKINYELIIIVDTNCDQVKFLVKTYKDTMNCQNHTPVYPVGDPFVHQPNVFFFPLHTPVHCDYSN